MSLLFKRYKTKFRYALQPVFSMLVGKEKEMPHEDWLQLIKTTEQRILLNPVDFLGTDLPGKDLMKDIVEEIFKEFDKDLKIKKKSIKP